MRKVFSSQAQVDAWLEEVGFVLDDGKAYWAADETRASYLTVTQNTSAVYTASNGTNYTLANYTSAAYCVVEYFELINGGMAFRFLFTNDSAAALGTPLQLAIVAKDDGSGFVFFFYNVQIYSDTLDGTLRQPRRWLTGINGDTSSVAMIAKVYDNVDSFIDAHVRVALALQAASSVTLFTFTCDGKKYLSGMFTGAATISM